MKRSNHDRAARSNRAITLVLAAGMCCAASMAAIAAPASDRLVLRTGIVDTSRGAVGLEADGGAMLPELELRPGQRLVVQLDGPMTPARRAQLDATGVRVLSYLPVNAFVVTATNNAQANAAAGLPFVRWATGFQNDWKIDPVLSDILANAQDPDAELIVVNVSFFADEVELVAKQALNAVPGVTVHASGMNGTQELLVTATVPASALRPIASVDGVQFIEMGLEAELRNATSREIVQAGQTGLTPLYDNGITGVGQVVAVIDGAINVNHCSFADTMPVGPGHRKILKYYGSFGTDSHGTHVGGTVAGKAPSGSNNDLTGVAYDAKLVFERIPGNLNGVQFYNQLSNHYNDGARVHTNSWGADFRTDYNAWTRAIDEFSYNFEDSLVLFAITNRSTLYTPENAKSVLAVGASQDWPNVNSHCSGGVGPTIDGRRKPEIYAPGCSTISSSSSTTCGTRTLTGTSMACPAVAGVAALVRQYFIDGYYPTGIPGDNPSLVPTGALMRAVLLNATRDMTSISGYPSNLEGWGRLAADDALHFPGDARSIVVRDVRNVSDEALSTGESYEFAIEVTGSAQPLKVTMAFTDPPAAPLAGFAPINNIDLVVTAPSGTVYRGNAINSGIGQSIANSATADSVNSVEQVIVASPEAGVWTVTIAAPSVNVGNQGFAVVATGAVADFLETSCDGDTNGDGVVNFVDLNAILGSFGTNDPKADLDGNGVVDFADLNMVLTNFGSQCN